MSRTLKVDFKTEVLCREVIESTKTGETQVCRKTKEKMCET